LTRKSEDLYASSDSGIRTKTGEMRNGDTVGRWKKHVKVCEIVDCCVKEMPILALINNMKTSQSKPYN